VQLATEELREREKNKRAKEKEGGQGAACRPLIKHTHLESGAAVFSGPAAALRTSHTAMRPSPAVVSSSVWFSWQMPALVENRSRFGERKGATRCVHVNM
jgi:hypothetical protein